MYVREVQTLNYHNKYINDLGLISEIRTAINDGTCFIFKGAIESKIVQKIRVYLTEVGRSSLPNYQNIVQGAPNFHRMNNWDKRSFVKGCFHQFSFFPWNQDVFGFFELFKNTYHMKNAITGIPLNKFLGHNAEDGCTARLSFQFYPAGGGGLNTHVDPVDYHQLTAPVVTMSKKGVDFKEGGSFLIKENNTKICLDDLTDIGDVSFFKSQIQHGVDPIDPNEVMDWLSFKGRWMVLPAVNKLANNSAIADAVDLN